MRTLHLMRESEPILREEILNIFVTPIVYISCHAPENIFWRTEKHDAEICQIGRVGQKGRNRK